MTQELPEILPSSQCHWPIVYLDENCPAFDSMTEDDRDRIEKMAIDLLWGWTGRKYGLCEVTVRPCREKYAQRGSTFWGERYTRGGVIPQVGGWTPALIGGAWFNISCASCPSDRCSCDEDSSHALKLPQPVHSIIEVTVAGEKLMEAQYKLSEGVLYRLDGKGWPARNNVLEEHTEPESDTWAITYLKGYEVPAGGQIAAGILACELAKAVSGYSECQLPKRVQSITRQGVSMAILDAFEGLEDGLTGIWEVDAWVKSVQHRRGTLPAVYSPDLKGKGRHTHGSLGWGR